MARIVPNNAILQVTFRQRWNQQEILNVLHWRLGVTGGGTVDGDNIQTVMHTWLAVRVGNFVSQLKNMNHVEWTYLSEQYQWLWPLRYTPTFDSETFGNGNKAGTPLPQNVCSVLTKKGVVADRHNIGRIHFSGRTTADHLNGSISAPHVTELANIAINLEQAIDVSEVPNATLMRPIIFNRVNPDQSVLLDGLTIMTTMRVIRRRTVGVGV